MHKGRAVLIMAVFLAFILLAFSAVTILTGRIAQDTPRSTPGKIRLADFDFSDKLAYIPHTSFLYYKNKLYTPEDFKKETVKEEPYVLSTLVKRFDPGNYGTYRLVLELRKGQVYGLSSYSAMYAQRLFIDGLEYPSVGIPGTTAATTVPKTNHYTIYFVPAAAQTEILIQFANFNHADFGGIFPLYIGTQEKMIARDAAAQQRVHILVGCMAMAFLFFLGMFFFFRRRFAFLWFSLSCWAMGLRMLIVEEKVIMLLLPDLSWKASIAVEYTALIVLMLTFFLYIHSMFRGAMHKRAPWAFGALCALYALTVLLTPPVFYTGLLRYFEYGSALFGIYMVAALINNVIRKKENRHMEHLLILAGSVSFIVLSFADIFVHSAGGYGNALGLAQTGMMVFVFANMIALALQFSRAEAELHQARQSERAMQETNELLDKLSRLKTEFLQNISHEMKTPLAVISASAQLTRMQIEENAVDGETLQNLRDISLEAQRLSKLANQLLKVSEEKENLLAQESVAVESLFYRARSLSEPILYKHGNRLVMNLPPDLPPVRVNSDMILQVLLNLLTNASRHCHSEVISLSAQEMGTMVQICVRDSGDGIAEELLPFVFERHRSGDGGTGLGLAICKEAVQSHGGTIEIESEPGRGAAVFFTIPVDQEGVL